MKLLTEAQGDQYGDDEPAVVQANRDPGDASEFDLRVQQCVSYTSIVVSAGLDARKILEVRKTRCC